MQISAAEMSVTAAGGTSKQQIMNCNGVREVSVKRKQMEAKQRKPIQIAKKEHLKIACDTLLVERLAKNIE